MPTGNFSKDPFAERRHREIANLSNSLDIINIFGSRAVSGGGITRIDVRRELAGIRDKLNAMIGDQGRSASDLTSDLQSVAYDRLDGVTGTALVASLIGLEAISMETRTLDDSEALNYQVVWQQALKIVQICTGPNLDTTGQQG